MNLTRLIDTLSFAGFTSNGKSEYALTDGKGSAIYIYPEENKVKIWEDIRCHEVTSELNLNETNAIEILQKCGLFDKSIIQRVKALVPTAEQAG